MSTKKPNKSDSAEEFYLEKPEEIPTDLDPHLQDVLLAAQAGEDLDPAFAGQAFEDGPMVVECIAKLHNPDEEVPGLTVNRKIGQIVTGTVEVNRIEAVRNHPNTISLKRATELHLELEHSVGEIRAVAQQLRDGLPPDSPMIDGSGVIVGIVDYGCDFVHENFRNEDGSTRLLYLWDQGGLRTATSPAGYDYGREFSAARINRALESADPYQALRYGPGFAAHGTHVMDIAAGNGRATGWPGVAPKADLIFVQVATSDIGAEDSFGNSRRLLEAVEYIFTKAREANKPAVVNLSLGTHGGPHDGSTLVEQGFDALLQEPGRAIVIAAGNSWERASHASGTILPGEVRRLGWQIVASDTTDNEMEVWYSGNDRLEVSLITPGGQRLGPIPAGQTLNLKRQQDRVGRIIHRQNDPNNQDNQIDILFKNNLVGDWFVELHNVGTAPASFHAWVERDDRGQSGFAPADDDRTHTLGSISCGQHTVVVGAYDDREPGLQPLTWFTSEGPTRDGRQKPEISAPGQAVVAARSLSQGRTAKSGTSMAAPHVTGAIALLMQAAGKPLPGADIRRVLLATIRNNPPAGAGWHSRYGSGRIDCLSCLLTQFDRATSGRSLVPMGPVARQLPVAANPANGVVGSDLFILLAQAAAQSNVRFRVQVEVEPV